MKGLFFGLILSLFLLPFSAAAFEMDIVKDPICFVVKNESDVSVTGSIVTDYYMSPDGTKARHRSNFRMGKAGSKDEQGYPDDMAEFCTYGPFYPDRKLEFVIRTLFPVFSCITKIDQGPIIIHATRKADDSGYDYSAQCYE